VVVAHTTGQRNELRLLAVATRLPQYLQVLAPVVPSTRLVQQRPSHVAARVVAVGRLFVALV
jgi:hypothetical protein